MMKKVFTLGQKVWFEPDDKRDKGFYTTITKVGRLYYTIDRFNAKFDKEILHNNESPYGFLYSSEQEAREEYKARVMFVRLQSNYGIRPTLKQMQKVYEILGLEFNE